MNYSKFRFTLDIHKHQSQISVPVMYGDTAVQLLITLSDGGMPYTIGKSCWAQFIASKPGIDEPLTRACLIEDGTTIRLDFDSDIANVAGVYNCEVRLYGAEGILTSPCFTMVVDPRVTNSIGMDSGEATNLLDQIGTAMAEFQKAEDARENAEAERVAAEEERQAVHNSLVSNVNLEVFDDGSIILQAFDATGNLASQSVIDSIGTDTIADQAVTSKKIAPGAVKSSHLAQSAVGSYELADEAVCDYHLDSALSGRLTGFDKTDAELDRRISQLEEHISDDYFVTDNDVAYEKAVPARACTYAKLASFGGMTHKSKNLFPYPYQESAIVKTINGITFTVNNDGSITVNGTATTTATFVLFQKTNAIMAGLLPGDTYTLSKSHADIHLFANTYKSGGVEQEWLHTLASPSTKAFPEDAVGVNCYLAVLSGVTVNNVTVYPMLNEGSTALPYELWYEGLRDSKVTEIKSHGANLISILPWANQTINGVTITLDEDGVYHLSGTATATSACLLPLDAKLPIGKYTLSLNCNKVIGTAFENAVYLVARGTDLDWKIQSSTHLSNAYVTVTTTTDIVDFMFAFMEGVNCDGLTIAPMCNEGDYIPYKPHREPISYPIPAAIQAINGYGKDGFVIDLEKQTSAYEGSEKPLPVQLKPIIEVEGGGSLEFVNEYKNPVPSTVKYLLKEESSV